MNILRETMTLVRGSAWRIRVWVQVPLDCKFDHWAFNDHVQNLLQQGGPYSSYMEVAKRILELPDVNAVEVLDESGNGDVLYKDWP
jgi:hypothetical protein